MFLSLWQLHHGKEGVPVLKREAGILFFVFIVFNIKEGEKLL